MKPFGALGFILKNRGRVLTVVLMIALTGLLYVGGCYLTNIEVEALKIIDTYREFVFVSSKPEDLDGSSLAAFLKEVEEHPALQAVSAGGNDFRYPTTFGFQNGDTAWCFTPEEFRFINQRLGVVDSTEDLYSDTLIISRREARFLQLSEGELFEKNREEACFYYGNRPYRVVLSDRDAFFICLLSEEAVTSSRYMVSYVTPQDRETFQEWKEEGLQRYPKLRISTWESRRADCEENFLVNRFIFISIIIVVTCVFFITINAVLVGIYDKRKKEFCLYSRIGIPRKQVYGKVIRELLYICVSGMLLGFLISMGSITLINRVIYEEQGLQLYYYHSWSLISWLVCNGCILLPSILLRLRFVRNAENEDVY